MESIDTALFGTVHRDKKINSKVKGNKNELTLTKILTDWTGQEFVRVPQSGGLRWLNRMDVCGDVINNDPKFNCPFSIETKHVANLGLKLSQPELRKNSVVYTYFEQCKRDAEAAGKIPFLIIRQNGMKTGCYYIFLSLQLSQVMKISNYIEPVFSGELVGFKSEEFFEKISFKILKWVYDDRKNSST